MCKDRTDRSVRMNPHHNQPYGGQNQDPEYNHPAVSAAATVPLPWYFHVRPGAMTQLNPAFFPQYQSYNNHLAQFQLRPQMINSENYRPPIPNLDNISDNKSANKLNNKLDNKSNNKLDNKLDNKSKSFTIDAILGTKEEKEDKQDDNKTEGRRDAPITGFAHPGVRENNNNPYLHGLSYPTPVRFPLMVSQTSHHGDKDKKSPGSSHGDWKQGKSKRVRTIFTPDQLERLEAQFERQQYMVGSERFFLASHLNLTEAQVKVWFQNRRIKWRKTDMDRMKSATHDLYKNNERGADSDDDDEAVPDSEREASVPSRDQNATNLEESANDLNANRDEGIVVDHDEDKKQFPAYHHSPASYYHIAPTPHITIQPDSPASSAASSNSGISRSGSTGGDIARSAYLNQHQQQQQQQQHQHQQPQQHQQQQQSSSSYTGKSCPTSGSSDSPVLVGISPPMNVYGAREPGELEK